MSTQQHPRPDDRRGGTAVEDRTTKSTASTGIGLGVLGAIAGVIAVSGFYSTLMGVVAAVLGVIALITAGGVWKRAKDQTGEQVGTTGTNASIGAAVAGALALVLGIVGFTAVDGTTDVDEGVDQVEQDAQDLGDDVQEGFDDAG